jgi:hypothetical protein
MATGCEGILCNIHVLVEYLKYGDDVVGIIGIGHWLKNPSQDWIFI